MHKLLLIVIALLISTVSYGQTAKAYVDAKAYLNNKFIALKDIRVEEQTARGGFDNYEYRLFGTGYKINKEIEGKYWAIEVDSVLYLNCRRIFKLKGYTNPFQQGLYVRVVYKSNKYLHFRAGRTNVFGVPRSPITIDPEVIPMVMTTSTASIVNYLYSFRTDDVTYFSRGVMMNYVENASPNEEAGFIKHVNQLIKAEDDNDGFRQ